MDSINRTLQIYLNETFILKKNKQTTQHLNIAFKIQIVIIKN